MLDSLDGSLQGWVTYATGEGIVPGSGDETRALEVEIKAQV